MMPVSNILNFAIIYLIYLFFCAVTKSTFRGTIATYVFLFVILVANQVKISYSTEPIYIKDIMFLNSPSTFTGILDGTLMPILNSMWEKILSYLVLSVVVSILAKKFEQKYYSLKLYLITFSIF